MNPELKDKWFTIMIPTAPRSSLKTDQLWIIEDEIHALGIRFDTGMHMAGINAGYRDWELDWSLSGGTAETVIEVLESKKIDFKVINIRDPDPELIAQLEEE